MVIDSFAHLLDDSIYQMLATRQMVKTKPQTVPVTFRAVVQRLKRVLAKDGRTLRAARSERVRLDLGDFYIVDNSRNLLVDKHTNVVEMAREYGVLNEYEEVIEEE